MAKPLVSDALWERIEPLLPPVKLRRSRHPGRKPMDRRKVLTGIVFVLKTGIPWADLPARFGKHDTVRKRFDRWCAGGVWERIAHASGDPDLAEVQLDATTVKAHPVAWTGRRRRAEKKRTRTPGGVSVEAAAD